MQDDRLEPIHNRSVPRKDVALKTYRERWTIETDGKKGSGRSLLTARRYDDDDDSSHIIHFYQLLLFRLSFLIFMSHSVFFFNIFCL